VPKADLELHEMDRTDPALSAAVAEVSLDHPLLKTGAEIICSPSNVDGCVEQVFKACVEDVLPILIFAIDTDNLSEQDINELRQINSFGSKLPVFFIRVPPKSTRELTESLQDAAKQEFSNAHTALFDQLCKQGFLTKEVTPKTENVHTCTQDRDASASIIDSVRPKSTLIEDFSLFPCFLMFVRQVLQYHVIAAACVLNDAHTRCLGI
jgi:receptor-interacting serine/threonine-protein kinase 5